MQGLRGAQVLQAMLSLVVSNFLQRSRNSWLLMVIADVLYVKISSMRFYKDMVANDSHDG